MGKRVFKSWREITAIWLKRCYGIEDDIAIQMILDRVPKDCTNVTKSQHWLGITYMPRFIAALYSSATTTGNAADDAILQRFKKCDYNPFVKVPNLQSGIDY